MKIFPLILLSLISFTSAFADESLSEKAANKSNDAKRTIVQKAHRVDEKACDKTDKNCFAKKASNRANETKEYVKDKAQETKDVIDKN